MNLSVPLTRDLVFFDVETTGLNVLRDRIVQIALIKYQKNNPEPIELQMLINPGIPISEESMSIHGITPKDLEDKPTFVQVGQQLFDFIGDADLAGYNAARFDIPMLIEEFYRVGLEFDMNKRRVVDVQRIFYKMEPRTLKAALKFYCQKELTDAHDAMADTRATVDIFRGQLDYYEGKNLTDEEGKEIEAPIKKDIQALSDFTNDYNIIDATQRLKYDHNGIMVFNFGKYVGQPVEEVLAVKDKNYAHWILEKEFSAQVKQTIRQVVKDIEKKKNAK